MVEPLGIEPSPRALQAHVRTIYTKVPFKSYPTVPLTFSLPLSLEHGISQYL